MPPPNTPEEGLPSAARSGSRRHRDRQGGSDDMDLLGNQQHFADPAASATIEAQRTSAERKEGEEEAEERMAQAPKLDWQGLEYVGEVNQTLFCPICQTPLVSPVITRCGHVFCSACFDEMLEHNSCCPLDRKSFVREIEKGRFPAKPAPRIYQNQLDELLVRCPNLRCPRVKPRSAIRRHYEDECGHTMVPCPDPSCRRPIARLDLGDGHDGTGCRHSVMNCPDCGDPIDASNVDDHYEHHCAVAPSPCEHCGLTVLRHRYAVHQLQECEEVVRPCQYHAEGCRHKSRRADLGDHEQGCAFGAILRMRQLFEAKLTQQERTISKLEKTVLQQEKAIRELSSARGPRQSSSANVLNTNPVQAVRQDSSAPRRSHSVTAARRESLPASMDTNMQLMQYSRHDDVRLETTSATAEGPGHSGVVESGSSGSQSPQDEDDRPRLHRHEDDAHAFILAGLNSCEERVGGLQRRLAEQDARHSLMLVNEVLPLQDQLTELRSAFTGLAMDMRYIIARQKSISSGVGGSSSNPMGAGAASRGAASTAAGSSSQRAGDNSSRDPDLLHRPPTPLAVTPPRL